MGVSSCTLNYGDWDISKPSIQSGKAHFVIAGRTGVWRHVYDGLETKDMRRVQYLNHIDVNPTNGRAPYSEWEKRWVFNRPMVPHSNWPGYAGVIKLDSNQINYLVEAIKPIMDDPRVDDVMLDVDGERLWTAAWNNWTPAEKANFASCQRELNDRWGELRDTRRPDMNLFANGTWAAGHKALRPAVEHHDNQLPDSPDDFWWGYLDPARWDSKGQPLAIVYASTKAAAEKWAKVPGVGVVAIQETYVGPATEYLPFGEYIPRSATPPPPPPPPSGEHTEAEYQELLVRYQAELAAHAETQNDLDDALEALMAADAAYEAAQAKIVNARAALA